MSHVQTAVAGTALCLVASMLAGSPVGAAGDVSTCHGMPATIVGDAGGYIHGTAGDDVIVTQGAISVGGKEGDDTICLTGTTRTVIVTGGPGDDVVDGSSLTTRGIDVFLGGGDDTYVGTTGRDNVHADNENEGVSDADTIDTGDGEDFVRSGQPGQPTGDVVRLGRDADDLTLSGYPTDRAEFDGGPTSGDYLALDGGGKRWLIDQRGHQISRTDHRGRGRIAGFNDITVEDAILVTFVGGDLPESLSVEGGLSARMGGGDDELMVSLDRLTVTSFAGESGQDTMYLDAWVVGSRPRRENVIIDVPAGTVRVISPIDARAAISVENASVSEARRVRMVGGPGPNTFRVREACHVALHGRAGDDDLGLRAHTCVRPPVMFGGAGDDHLRGSEQRDILDGGLGYDVALGRGGRDSCAAEVRRRCELT